MRLKRDPAEVQRLERSEARDDGCDARVGLAPKEAVIKVLDARRVPDAAVEIDADKVGEVLARASSFARDVSRVYLRRR